MQKTNKMFYRFIVIVVLTIIYSNLYSSNFKTLRDLNDNLIQVPVNPQRIASLHAPTYDRILMLDDIKHIALMPMRATPLAIRLFPDIKDIPIVTSYKEINIEQMLHYKVDLVFYSMFLSHAGQLKAAGISSACPFSEKLLPASMNEFREHYKRQIRFFGEILGYDAKLRAEKYCAYFDNTFNKILSETSGVFKKKIPRVYYGGLNGDLLSTQGKKTTMRWCVEAAGGKFVTDGIDTHFPKVNIEQIIKWDPDFIFLGMLSSLNLVSSNIALKKIKAVQNNNVCLIPAGIFWWDLGGGETALLPLFLAKKLHPELFKDWDLIKEMKAFYIEIYRKEISLQDAERILKALPPI